MVAFYPEQLCLPAIASGAPLLDVIHHMDALSLLRALPSGYVDCVVSSPPYWNLRDYNVAGQIGLEPTPAAFIERLMQIFREVRRVLKPTGTVWINLGDTYASKPVGSFNGGSALLKGRNLTGHATSGAIDKTNCGLPEKSLMMIPARFAIAMQDEGWILRSDIIWHKPNPMPESVTDRPTKAHEYVYLFAKESRYWYDANAVREPIAIETINRWGPEPGRVNPASQQFLKNHVTGQSTFGANPAGRNLRSVWTIIPEPFAESHFAVMPSKLVETCIKAGCPPHGIVLDPFMGSGTTAITARRLGRHYIGSDLNPEYVQMARKRLAQTDPYQHKQVGSMKQLSMFAAAQP